MDIDAEIQALKARNQKVEADKAWEQSWARRLSIGLMTYVIAGVWLAVINDTYPFLKAFVPSVGYILSTLSLPFIKNWWVKNTTKKSSLHT